MLKSWRVASARPRPKRTAGAAPADRRAGARARELLRALLDGFEQNDLLTYASAISFQILTAVVPFLLFVLAVAGLLHLDDVWRLHLEPQIQAHVSQAVFAVIANTARAVLRQPSRAVGDDRRGARPVAGVRSGASRDGRVRADLRLHGPSGPSVGGT